jgi:hypothetical protein
MHYGWFKVQELADRDRSMELLRAAQEACAVVRCEFHYHSRTWEVHAWHPDFAIIQKGEVTPEYDVILDDPDGMSPKRIRFERR